MTDYRTAYLWKILVGVGVALLVGLSLKFGPELYRSMSLSPEQQFDRVLERIDVGRATAAELRKSFPEDYARLRTEAVAQVKDGASNEALRTSTFAFMRRFTMDNLSLLARAPHDSLAEFRNAQLRTVRIARSDSPTLCAHVAGNGLTPADRPGLALQRALDEATAAQLRAMAAGARAPVQRPSTLSPTDSAAWMKASKARGLNPEDFDLLANGGLERASADEQCRIGSALAEAVATLPAEQADRITAALMAG
ncbi:hypothetical protein ACBY01_09860 [Sphingomonas sp. ac-8]|uniref:hypothetical protein n=1 Tax=Sphingomonas sp. ac-8 TaxID=3242977 RepID=UPI003A81012C